MGMMKRMIDKFEEEQYQDDQDDFDMDELRPPFYSQDNYLDLEVDPLEVDILGENLS